jgi:KaiC/GvpD/RAD55 family RecA-like ATPase
MLSEIREKKQDISKQRATNEYFYRDANGKILYKIVRYEDPKEFRPYRQIKPGVWTPGIQGVERVLYNLRAVIDSDYVIYTEGEKDADNLIQLGFVATTHAFGANSWLEPYAEVLRGKHVILCGDNDETGKELMDKIFKSVSLVADKISRIVLPEGCKDISDRLAGDEYARETMLEMIQTAIPMVPENDIDTYDLKTMFYMEQARILEHGDWGLDLGDIAPSFRRFIPPIEPGGLVVIMGETGKGKTVVAQNIAVKMKNIPTYMFQLEVQRSKILKRFLAVSNRLDVNKIKITGETASDLYFADNIYVCCSPGLTTDEIERRIVRAALLMGEKPKIVIIDYIQLIKGMGKRYEVMSKAAEELKRIAKATETVIIVISQIGRREEKDKPIGLYDAKDSGSIENSAELVLGVYRDPEQDLHIYIEALKNTNGQHLGKVRCYIEPNTLVMNEACDPRQTVY